MALANVACILSERQSENGGKGVLMIDWDLEAPGLHRYFRHRLPSRRLGLPSSGDYHESRSGLIDLFYDLNEKTDRLIERHKEEHTSNPESQPIDSEQLARNAISEINLQDYIISTTLNSLSLLKAGVFSTKDPNEYSERVNKFNWEALYQKSPKLIRVLAETLAEKYAYILIDSRTGVTDISGICTMILPEKLVVVFTPNLQSLKGGLDLIRRATDYRKESSDLRPLLVFPLVSRVEANEPDLRHDWRFGNLETKGYQNEFEDLLSEVYGRRQIKLNKYFDEMQIQQIPRYAYGEEIAALTERVWDKFSLRRSYQTFTLKLVDSTAPWEGEVGGDGSFAQKETSFSEYFLNILSSVGRFARIYAGPLLASLLIVGAIVLWAEYVKARKASADLNLEKQNSVLLQQRVAELEQQLKEPLKAIQERDATIKQLYSTLDQSNSDLEKSRQDALKSKAQARSATDAAQIAQQQSMACEARLTRCEEKIR